MTRALFDAAHYAAQLPGAVDAGAADPDRLHADFCARGDALGLNPSPYFATRHYKARYPDWAAGGARTALEDYACRAARGDWRQPHPLIDPGWYLDQHPDLRRAGVEPLLHFQRHGDGECRSPSALFDAGFYARCYLELGAGHPFAHYQRAGRAAGHLPRPDPARARPGALAAALGQLGPRPSVMIVLHDAQRAGVPILALTVARGLVARGWAPVFVLHRAGPLRAAFEALGPVFIMAEGWAAADLAQALAVPAPVPVSAPVPALVPALVMTAAAADLALPCAAGGRPVVLMIHEMRPYLERSGAIAPLLAAGRAGVRMIASMPRMAETLRPDLGELPVLVPVVETPQAGLGQIRARRRSLRAGAARVIIGAGHADHRKGFDLFLDAARALARARAGMRFVWLGALDGWAQDLAARAGREGLDLILPGFVAAPGPWYAASDAYLLTSREDAGPGTAVQAARLGVPVVGYAAEIGLIGLSGGHIRWAPAFDRDRLLQALAEALDHETPQTRRARRRHAAGLIDIDAYVSGIETALRAAPPSGGAA